MPTDAPSSLSISRRLRFLAKDSVLYGGAGALNKAFGLITFPLLSRHFSVGDYGLVDLFTLTASLLASLFIFGQDSAVGRFVYEYKEVDARRQIISQSLLLQIFLITVILPVIWIFSAPLAGLLHESGEAPLLLKLVLLQVPFLLLINFSQNLLKWTFSRARFLAVSLGFVTLYTLSLLVAVLLFDIGIAGVFFIGLAVQACFAGLGLFFVRGWLTKPRGTRYLSELVPFAIPYGIICLAGAFVPVMERTLVYTLLGGVDLGLYAAGAKVAMLLMILVQAFQTAWGPFSLAIHKSEDSGRTYDLVLKGFALMACTTVLLLSASGQTIIAVLASDRYAGAAVVVFPLAMGLAMQGMSWITEIGINLSKKSYLYLYSYIVYVLVTGAAIYLLSRPFGMAGAAFGVMIGHGAKAVTASRLAQRVYPIPWSYVPTLGLVALTLTAGLLAHTAGVYTDIYQSALFAAVSILAVLGFGWFIVFTGAERERLLAEVHARLTAIRT